MTTVLTSGARPPGHVQADALHRHDAPLDDSSRRDIADDGLLELGLAGLAESAYGLLEGDSYVGVEIGERLGQRGSRHPELGGSYAVELLAGVEHRVDPAIADVVTDRTDRRERLLDVELQRAGRQRDRPPDFRRGLD